MNAVCILEVTLPDDSKTAEVGSTIQASGDLSLSAAQDVNLRAATVQSKAALTVNATRELNITAGQSTLNNDSTSFSSLSDWLSSSTSQSRNTVNRVDAVSSELGGQTVTPIRREPAPKRLAPAHRCGAAPTHQDGAHRSACTALKHIQGQVVACVLLRCRPDTAVPCHWNASHDDSHRPSSRHRLPL
jgi:hypothetical protein